MVLRVLFWVLLAVSASGFVSPPIALALGLFLGLGVGNPYTSTTRQFCKKLLQVSVVGLGFGMNLNQVLRAGSSGFVYTFAGIVFALSLGMAIGALLKVERIQAFLISTGTAICGGSAIAAIGPITQASNEQMAVSLGTVFVLNSVALLAFPSIGSALHLSQTQFGLWAALAIHDTSSVVGATAKYGAEALAIGTTVKLARALWIVPLAFGTALVRGSKAKIQWPWFIGLFVLAAVANTYLPAGPAIYGLTVFAWLSKLAKIGLTVTLFLIGSGISRNTVKRVGVRPMLQGVLLWIVVSVVSLWLIVAGYIAI